MNILIAPVSGGRFINQLAELYNLSEHYYKADVILAASGGVIASSLWVSANYTPHGIIRNTKMCNSKLFVKSWSPPTIDFIPSCVIGFFQGSIYQHSEIYKECFKSMITPGMLRNVDMWILTYNMNIRSADVFCTSNEDTSHFKNNSEEQFLTKTSQFTYLNGDFDKFCDIAIASASIPAIVPPKYIDGVYYCDGGVLYASPFLPLREQISTFGPIHIIYINGLNINITPVATEPRDISILETSIDATTAVLQSHIIQDRYLCYSYISSKGDAQFENITLQDYFEKRSNWSYSLLELYPTVPKMLDIVDFNGDDACDMLMEQINHIGCRVWYVVK